MKCHCSFSDFIFACQFRFVGLYYAILLISQRRLGCAAIAVTLPQKTETLTDNRFPCVISQKGLFILFFRQQRLECLSRIDDAQRPGLSVDDRGMHETAPDYHRQDVIQSNRLGGKS